MVIALDPLSQREYVCKGDRDLPEEEQTVWLLMPLNARSRAEIDDRYMQANAEVSPGAGGDKDEAKTTMAISIHGRNHAALAAGLIGWRNFKDSKGEAVEARKATKKGSRIDDRSLSRIPEPVRQELAEVILDGFGPEEERD